MTEVNKDQQSQQKPIYPPKHDARRHYPNSRGYERRRPREYIQFRNRSIQSYNRGMNERMYQYESRPVGYDNRRVGYNTSRYGALYGRRYDPHEHEMDGRYPRRPFLRGEESRFVDGQFRRPMNRKSGRRFDIPEQEMCKKNPVEFRKTLDEQLASYMSEKLE